MHAKPTSKINGNLAVVTNRPADIMDSRLNIFLVDDDKVINMLHEKMIERTFGGIHVQAFSNPVVAEKTLRELLDQAPQPSIVMLDINMPEMNAWGFLDLLNDSFLRNGFQVIIVSSSVDEEDKGKAAKYSSVVDFVEKPLKKDWLLKNEKRFFMPAN